MTTPLPCSSRIFTYRHELVSSGRAAAWSAARGPVLRRIPGLHSKGRREHGVATLPTRIAASSRWEDGRNGQQQPSWLRFQDLRSDVVAQCSSTSNTAQEMVHSANQILHQLETAGAATQAASAGQAGGIVSGYTSSNGSMASIMGSVSFSSSSSDNMASMDEYSSSHLDFSDLANEDSAQGEGGKGEAAGGGAYGKANYEVCKGRTRVWRGKCGRDMCLTV